MERTYVSETLVDSQRTAQRYDPEDGTLHNQLCENFKFSLDFVAFFSSSYSLFLFLIGFYLCLVYLFFSNFTLVCLNLFAYLKINS
jgi:hypothetical protein